MSVSVDLPSELCHAFIERIEERAFLRDAGFIFAMQVGDADDQAGDARRLGASVLAIFYVDVVAGSVSRARSPCSAVTGKTLGQIQKHLCMLTLCLVELGWEGDHPN